MDWTQQQHQQHQYPHLQPALASSQPKLESPPHPAPARPYSEHVASGSYQQTLGHGWPRTEVGGDPAVGGQHQQRYPANIKMAQGHDPYPSAAAAVNFNHYCPPAPRVDQDQHQHARQQHALRPYRVGGATSGNVTARAGGTGAWQRETTGPMGGGGAGRGTPKAVWISGGGGSTGAAAAVGQHYYPANR